MKMMVRFALSFYVVFTLFLCVFICLYLLHVIPYNDVVDLFYVMYHDANMRSAVACITIAILLFNFLFARAISGDQQKGETIAFDNPSGRVSVSLSAIEDLIRRSISRVPEVKEVKSAIHAGKRGLEINSRIVLNTDVNIPEMTSRLQELVKRKIQHTIGLEETVVVRVHVVKILPGPRRSSQEKQQEIEDDHPNEPNIPFQGYRV